MSENSRYAQNSAKSRKIDFEIFSSVTEILQNWIVYIVYLIQIESNIYFKMLFSPFQTQLICLKSQSMRERDCKVVIPHMLHVILHHVKWSEWNDPGLTRAESVWFLQFETNRVLVYNSKMFILQGCLLCFTLKLKRQIMIESENRVPPIFTVAAQIKSRSGRNVWLKLHFLLLLGRFIP